MGFNIGPRVVRATGGGINRVGNYRIHQFPPDIVTDGLVINLDPGNVNSLGVNDDSTITDLTGNGNNGLISNGGGYSHLYGGTVLLNSGSSVDDYINVSNGGSNIMEKSFTLDFWLRYHDIGSGRYTNVWSTQGYSGSGIGFAFYTYGSEIRIWGWPTANAGNLMMINPTGVLANDTWYNIVITRDMNTEKLICYKNAIGIGTYNGVTADYEADGDDTYSFGTRDGANYPLDAYVSTMRGYNRALSPTEISQNYEATKIRHGVASSTTFTPTCAGSGGKVDVLCIGGGGGGGTQHGGGGGAGGYLETTGLTVTSGGTYTAAIGAGGAGTIPGGSFTRPNGSDGGNSVFSGTGITTMTSVGGGGGSSIATANRAGSAGGSGGGGALDGTGGSGTTSGGAGTSGQGFAGGGHFGHTGSGTYGGGAGGGGAGSVGQDGQSSKNASAPYVAGAGGSGKTSSITGSPVTRAGGGGGGSHDPDMYGLGGSGGGGQGGLGNDNGGDNAIPRTGSGGGGSGAHTAPGGAGAHGVIILRYPAEDYNVEMLIVGGGGGGGATSDVDGAAGGGAGAGGLVYYESYAVKSGKNYIVEVGVGGDGGTTGANIPNSRGDNGIPSKFGDVFAIGGGGGGGGYDGTVAAGRNDGQVGGSGGGGGSNGGTPAAGYGLGGKGTTDQGNDGGNGSDASGGDGAGGGGGASAKGGDGVGGAATAQGGAGGAGGSGIIILAYKGPQRGEGGTVSTTSRPGYTVHTFTDSGANLFIA